MLKQDAVDKVESNYDRAKSVIELLPEPVYELISFINDDGSILFAYTDATYEGFLDRRRQMAKYLGRSTLKRYYPSSDALAIAYDYHLSNGHDIQISFFCKEVERCLSKVSNNKCHVKTVQYTEPAIICELESNDD